MQVGQATALVSTPRQVRGALNSAHTTLEAPNVNERFEARRQEISIVVRRVIDLTHTFGVTSEHAYNALLLERDEAHEAIDGCRGNEKRARKLA